jgi:putative membrane protein
VYLDQNVQLLVDCIGACERIRNTPLPFAYVVHLRRALLLYCLTLPFALLEAFGYGTIAVSTAISYILFGIEEIGVEIEDPFGVDDNDLPLDAICRTIDRNLRALLPESATRATDAGE